MRMNNTREFNCLTYLPKKAEIKIGLVKALESSVPKPELEELKDFSYRVRDILITKAKENEMTKEEYSELKLAFANLSDKVFLANKDSILNILTMNKKDVESEIERLREYYSFSKKVTKEEYVNGKRTLKVEYTEPNYYLALMMVAVKEISSGYDSFFSKSAGELYENINDNNEYERVSFEIKTDESNTSLYLKDKYLEKFSFLNQSNSLFRESFNYNFLNLNSAVSQRFSDRHEIVSRRNDTFRCGDLRNISIDRKAESAKLKQKHDLYKRRG